MKNVCYDSSNEITLSLSNAKTMGPFFLPGENVHQRDISNNDIIREKPHPNLVSSDPTSKADPQPTYIWKKRGHTECSATCGTGEKREIQRRGDWPLINFWNSLQLSK